MSKGPDRIFISRSPGETRAALLSGERVVEIVHLRDAEPQTGAVYAGRIGERVAGSTDVFVDIGIGPAGLLETKGQKFTSGQLVAVEVLTPARADKGHKLRLANLAVLGETKGLILSAPHPVAGWQKQYQGALQEIVVDPASHKNAFAKLLNAEIVVTSSSDITWAEIEEQVDAALQAEVPLPSGGRLHIEQTSALVSIDIDAGSSSIQHANTEAMTVIAQQMRLRNLAGHILIDVIHMKGKQRFVDALKEACAADPVETRIMGLTPSGMIDVVRQRTRPSLAETLLNPETSAYRALHIACRELITRRAAKIQINVASAVAALLNEQLRGAYQEALDTAKGDIVIAPQAGFALSRIEVGA